MWDHSAQYWAILTAANLPLFIGLGKVVFGGWGEFLDCLAFWVRPDLLSALRGEWTDDLWAECKLLVFMVTGAGVVLVEHVGMVELGWVGPG
ncbi:MAG TPA: hypothetical protein VFF69_14530 [Phycisphaerales bacterium]|nr:hypothetical protein [Phycisphaerales bacterium]